MSLSLLWPDARRVVALVTVSFLLLAASGCAESTAEPDPPFAPASPMPPIEKEVTSAVPNPLPEFVTAKGVALAAVIIATGNVSSAIEQGLVSPKEVDLARKAIAEGYVQDWVDAAESE